MQEALVLAEQGWGNTGTNPLVGALVVKDGCIVGRGYHRRIGEAHAEIVALTDAGARARGATLYVNLEPCCTTGRTPPCVVAIARAGITRVVIGMRDPNPEVDGRGIAGLQQSNIRVDTGVLEPRAVELNAWFAAYIRRKIPYMILKIAISRDGRISGFPERYITGPAARRYVHSLRSRIGAVMIGIGTVLADNPRLTDRLVGRRNPARVVIDPRLRIPEDALVLEPTARRIIITDTESDPEKRRRLAAGGVEFVLLPGTYFPLETVLRELPRHDIGSVMIEGGGVLFSQVIEQAAYDELLLFRSNRTAQPYGFDIMAETGLQRLIDTVPGQAVGEDTLFHVYRDR